MPQTPPFPIDVFAGGLALLAYITALYVLAGREQKTPSITSSIYSTSLLILFSMLCSVGTKLLQNKTPKIATFFGYVSPVLFIAALCLVTLRVWQAHNRRVNLRNDHLVANLRILRWIKAKYRSLDDKPIYEHNPEPLTRSLLDRISKLVFLEENANEITSVADDNLRQRFSLSFAFCAKSSIDTEMSQLAAACLQEGCWIQYSTCSRHPYEFVMKLKRAWTNQNANSNWTQVSSKVIVVDAYTRNFGFTDSVHEWHARSIKKQGVEYIAAAESFAGLHTAAAKAFNYVKDQMKGLSKDPRQPALVIYEGAYSLVDLESVEQYRIFMRHLFPSERLWGAMLTVVLEYGVPDTAKDVLHSGADIFCEIETK